MVRANSRGRGGTRGSEVSCAVIGAYFQYAELLGRDTAPLIVDLPYDVTHLTTPHARIDYDTFRTIAERFRDLFPDDPEACFRAGQKTFDLGSFGVVSVLISLVPAAPNLLYRSGTRLIPMQFSMMRVSYRSLGRRRGRLRYHLDPGYEAFPELIESARGVIVGMGALGGGSTPTVTPETTPDGFAFDIVWATPPNVLRRLYSVTVGRVASFRHAGEELQRSHTLLEARLAEAHELSRRLEALVSIGRSVERGLDATQLLERFSGELTRWLGLSVDYVDLGNGSAFGEPRWEKCLPTTLPGAAPVAGPDAPSERLRTAPFLDLFEEARLVILWDRDAPMGRLVLRGGRDAFASADEGLLRDALSRLEQALRNVTQFDELQSHREVLARKVRERTADLAAHAERLEASNAQLQEIDRAKRRFFTHLTHELKNPMTLLVSSVDALGQIIDTMDAGAPERLAQLVGVGRLNVGRLATAVDDLLDLAMLDESRLRPRWTRVDLGELCRRLAEEMAPWTLASDVGLELVLPEDDEAVVTRGDPRLLNKLLLNLVGNAVKFSPAGKSVRVELRRSAAEGVELLVADRGPGVPDVDKERIFQPFEQSEDGALHRAERGLGVGLSIAREAALLHDGTLTVRDRDGGGSVFALSLPLRAPTAADAPPVLEPVPRASTSPTPRPPTALRLAEMVAAQMGATASGAARAGPEHDADAEGGRQTATWPDPRSRRVLLVDDEPDILSTVGGMLENDFSVLRAASGQEALALLECQLPDAIVCDVAMPGMSGLELCQILRERRSSRDIPFLLLTAFGDLQDKLRGFAYGADDYVTKPFQYPELAARIQTQIRLRELMDENVAFGSTAVIGTMAAGIAHEMKNPLNILVNAVGPLTTTCATLPADSDAHILLDLIDDASARLRKLAEAFSRMLTQTSEALPTDVRHLLDDLLHARCSRLDPQTETTIRCDIDEILVLQKNQLAVVLGNLLDNAIEALRRKGHTGSLTLEAHLRAGHLLIVVEDTGLGMTGAQLRRAVTPFFTTKHPTEGGGLGLAVVRQLLVAVGGRLELSSAPEEGTCARVWIPLLDE